MARPNQAFRNILRPPLMKRQIAAAALLVTLVGIHFGVYAHAGIRITRTSLWPILTKEPQHAILRMPGIGCCARMGFASKGALSPQSHRCSYLVLDSKQHTRIMRGAMHETDTSSGMARACTMPLPGASLTEWAAATDNLNSNHERDVLIDRMLGEMRLTADNPTVKTDELESLARKALLYHEDKTVITLLQMGIRNMHDGNFHEAETNFAGATAMDPGFAEAWNKLATARYLAGDNEGSLVAIRKTLSLQPAHFGALSGMGLVLMKTGNFDGAAHAFGLAQRACPSLQNASTRQWIAECLQFLKSQLVSALTFLSSLAPQTGAIVITALVLASALSTSPSLVSDAAQVQPYLEAKIQMEDVRKVRADGTMEIERVTRETRQTRTGALIEELTHTANSVDSNQEKAAVAARLLDELAASTTPRAEEIVQLVWQTWVFHENLAVADVMSDGIQLLRDGDLKGAEWRFFNAVHFDPAYAEGWNKLATVHYLLGDYNTSLTEIEQTLELEPRHFGAIAGRGMVLMKLERFGEAAASYREASEINPAATSLQLEAEYAEALQKDVDDDAMTQ